MSGDNSACSVLPFTGMRGQLFHDYSMQYHPYPRSPLPLRGRKPLPCTRPFLDTAKCRTTRLPRNVPAFRRTIFSSDFRFQLIQMQHSLRACDRWVHASTQCVGQENVLPPTPLNDRVGGRGRGYAWPLLLSRVNLEGTLLHGEACL